MAGELVVVYNLLPEIAAKVEEMADKAIRKAAFEATPILVDDKLFLTTPYDQVFALNPTTGEKLWDFHPHVDLTKNYSEVTSRGVSAWRDSGAKAGEPCALRIFFGTLDARLIAACGTSA